jgi:arylsulfatase A-like enzyme|tara:strand:- start:431 stop:616 length:186 start_codon:yes stop_codon:yes gene_type:complete
MIRYGRWKMTYSLDDAGYGEDGSLYDLDNDADELYNLYTQPDYTSVVMKLKERVASWQEMA